MAFQKLFENLNKTFSARRINQICHTSGTPSWQRNYYDHIICDEIALQKIRQYIQNIQSKLNLWHVDQLHPNNPSKWQLQISLTNAFKP